MDVIRSEKRDLPSVCAGVTELIACTASHELNNIFMGIGCYLDILITRHAISDHDSHELLRIKEALRQAQLITIKLGTLAGMRDNGLDADTYQNLLQVACSLIRKGLKRLSIHLVETYDPPETPFPGPSSSFYHLILGLIARIVSVLPENSSREIHVGLTHSGSSALITIAGAPEGRSSSGTDTRQLERNTAPLVDLCASLGGHLRMIVRNGAIRFEASFDH